MEPTMNEKDIYFVGDIHGELKTIVWELVERYKIKDSNIVFCGDFGAGFGKKLAMENLYKQVEKRLEENNLTLWALRGNHDDPDFFDGLHNFPRLTFIQDHIPFYLSGYLIYPVGGAVSIDQEERKAWNREQEEYGSSKRYWWPGEDIVRKYEGLPTKVDIVISHDAPMDFDPITMKRSGDGQITVEMIHQMREGRNYLSWVLRQLNPSRWFHGHYHKSTSGHFCNTLYRGLSINEIFMLPPKSKENG